MTVAHTFRTNAFFITISTHRRSAIFQVGRIAELFVDTLLQQRMRGAYKLHAFLVMQNHVHLLLTPQSGPIEQTIAMIKDDFARRVISDPLVWALGFVVHGVHNLRDLETVRSYLHQAPVRAQLAVSPELYPYSSAYRHDSKSNVLITTLAPQNAS